MSHRIDSIETRSDGSVRAVHVTLFVGSEYQTRWRVTRLLTKDNGNSKLAKASGEWFSTVMHLAPHKMALVGNICPHATAGCVSACLNTAGRGRFKKTQLSRIARTVVFMLARDSFQSMLTRELEQFAHRAHKSGRAAAVRLNGTSDIRFHRLFPDLFNHAFPVDLFYDYTKDPARAADAERLNRNIERYHLTFSFSGDNWNACQDALARGSNVAMVFRSREICRDAIAKGFDGFPVIDGDESDERFMDDGPAIVALYAKGPALFDDTGFVVDSINPQFVQ